MMITIKNKQGCYNMMREAVETNQLTINEKLKLEVILNEIDSDGAYTYTTALIGINDGNPGLYEKIINYFS